MFVTPAPETDEYGARVYPSWLLDATPGADEALAEWRDHMAARRDLAAEQKRVNAEAAKLGKWRGSGPADAVYGPAEGVPTAVFEQAQAKKAEAAQALKAHAAQATRLRRRFEDLVQGADGLAPQARRKLAAAHAVERQAAAVQALADLRAALADRDAAWRAAGMPGLSWYARSNAPVDPNNAQAMAFRTLGVMVEGFDLDASERAAAGEDVPSLATLVARQEAAAREQTERQVAAVRKRNARGF